jgi:hypothetical protein
VISYLQERSCAVPYQWHIGNVEATEAAPEALAEPIAQVPQRFKVMRPAIGADA